jgi:glycosyltransferase involved in cell wall biosynthesis
MRIVLLIDCLDSGGAQRQICMLAVLLKKRGHDIHMLMYHPSDFFRPILEQANITVDCVAHQDKLHRIWALRKVIRADRPEVVLAYLVGPSIIAEFSGLPRRDFAVIVSERSLEYPGVGLIDRRLRFWLHRLADAVVTNSYAQEAALRELAPKLTSRTTTIMNCVDLERFRPLTAQVTGRLGELKVLCVGRFEREKNYRSLLEAVEVLHRAHPEVNLALDAYGDSRFINGKPGPYSGPFIELRDALQNSPVRGRFRLHAAAVDIVPLYQASDVLCLASLYEGCSNVICEAMACGKPVLASRVGDNPILVKDGANGFLFDPNSPADIAGTMLRFHQLSAEQRVMMGQASRRRAEEMLSPERFVKQYEHLIVRVRHRRAGARGGSCDRWSKW